MQMSPGTGINFHMKGLYFEQFSCGWGKEYIIVILRDGKKINLEDGRVEIVVDGKTRKLIFKVEKTIIPSSRIH